MANQQKGLTQEQETSRKKLLRDTRPIMVQILTAFDSREGFIGLMAFWIIMSIVFPAGVYLCLLLSVVTFVRRIVLVRRSRLPFRVPAGTDIPDYSNPIPGRRKYKNANGIFFLGNDKDGHELWLTPEDMLTHMLIFGTTGSGKTETLVSLAFNTIAMGSGFFYIDPKAAPKLAVQIYTLARMLGRDDDYRVLNYSIAGKPPSGAPTPKRLTNTNNPFVDGAAEALTQLLVSLIPPAEGQNAVFSQNAQTLITALMYGLVELRDKKEIELSIDTIREYMVLQKIDELARRNDLSEASKDSIKSFLSSVGWQENKPLEKQPRSLPEQFGYARSYFGLALASLTDTYGHIYSTQHGEVDMYDIIKNRRILVTMLPSLEKAPQELQNLGKISLSAVRNAISMGLGDKLEGTVADVLDSLPTASYTPFLTVVDEYAAIPTEGFAEVLTQGRGLGIAGIVASQDFAGIKKADEFGAQQILANTKIKLGMKLEDPQETGALYTSIAGQAHVTVTSGHHVKEGGDGGAMRISYSDQQSTSLDKWDRIDLKDLQGQIEGEFHAFFNGEVVYGDSFYANPPLAGNQQMVINRMLPVTKPDKAELETNVTETRDATRHAIDIITGKTKIETASIKMPDGIKNLATPLNAPGRLGKMDATIAGFLNWLFGGIQQSAGGGGRRGMAEDFDNNEDTEQETPQEGKAAAIDEELAEIEWDDDAGDAEGQQGADDYQSKLEEILGPSETVEEEITEIESNFLPADKARENARQINQTMHEVDYPPEQESQPKTFDEETDDQLGAMVSQFLDKARDSLK